MQLGDSLKVGPRCNQQLNNIVHGFSAYQVDFGRNPNLPANYVNQTTVLEGTTVSKTVGEHVSALYAARKAFTEAE